MAVVAITAVRKARWADNPTPAIRITATEPIRGNRTAMLESAD
jgi:hypothetical protein